MSPSPCRRVEIEVVGSIGSSSLKATGSHVISFLQRGLVSHLNGSRNISPLIQHAWSCRSVDLPCSRVCAGLTGGGRLC